MHTPVRSARGTRVSHGPLMLCVIMSATIHSPRRRRGFWARAAALAREERDARILLRAGVR